MKPSLPGSELRDAMKSLRQFFVRAVVFSVFTNLLVLAPTLYMLEVYGRVVNSRSVDTLLMLTVLVIGAYVVMELLDWVRGEVMHAAGLRLDRRLGERVFNATVEARLRNLPVGIAPLQRFAHRPRLSRLAGEHGVDGRADRAAVRGHHLRDERAAGRLCPGGGPCHARGRLRHRAQDQPAARQGPDPCNGGAAQRLDDAQECAGDRGDGHDGAHPRPLARQPAQVPRAAGDRVRSGRRRRGDLQVHPDRPELDGAGIRLLADTDRRARRQRQRDDRRLDPVQSRTRPIAAVDRPMEVGRGRARFLRPARPFSRLDPRSSDRHGAAAAQGRVDGGGGAGGRAGNPDRHIAQRQFRPGPGRSAGGGRTLGVRQVDAGAGAGGSLAGRQRQGSPRRRRRLCLEQAGAGAPHRLSAAGQRALRRHARREHRPLRPRRPRQGRGRGTRGRPA